jgi:hypothetical protein
MQNMIVSGRLHCSKQECAKLAAIQLRIIELSYLRKLEEEEKDSKKLDSESIVHEKISIIELSHEMVKIKSEQEKLEDQNHKNEIKDKVNSLNATTALNTNNSNLIAKTAAIKEEEEEEEENTKLFRSKDFENDSIQQEKMLVIILTNGRYESLKLYLESCSCLSKQKTAKTLDLKNLVHPNYKRSRDIIKLIEVN